LRAFVPGFRITSQKSKHAITKGSIQITTEQTSDFDPSNNINTPEINFVDGVPIFPWVKPVVVLPGSDFEMGYQYAMQLSHIFGDLTRCVSILGMAELIKALRKCCLLI